MAHNWNCDNDKCRDADGPVRLYPLSGGANLILCEACFAHENKYWFNCDKETGLQENWPQVDWATAQPYEAE